MNLSRSNASPNKSRSSSPNKTGSTVSLLPKKEVTRFGVVHKPDTKFPKEERFRWQRAQFKSDCVYELPDVRDSRSVRFGTATRYFESYSYHEVRGTD